MKFTQYFISHPVDEGLILARVDGKRLFIMNDAARFIWERRQGGAAAADIPTLMAARYGIDLERAEQDFREILGRWQAEGLVAQPGHRRYYRIGDRCFSVDYPDRTPYEALLPILGHLELDPGHAGSHRPAREFALHMEGERYLLRADDAELLSTAEIDAVMAKLAHEAALFAFDNSDWLISTHAAAVGKGRACALLPGVSGSGKSTLTAALLARPHIRYLTDDLSLLGRADLRVIPVPVALVLKRGSWGPLEPLLATLSSQGVHRRDDQDVRYLAPPRDQIAATPMPVEVVVFPRYVRGREALLTRLPLLEGLTQLIAAPCMVSPPITPQTMSRLVAWAREIPFYTLAYGSVAQAAALIDEMLERGSVE